MDGKGDCVDPCVWVWVVGAVMSISTAVYPFSANIPDQSVHFSSDEEGSELELELEPSPGLRPRARTSMTGVGHSRSAAGEG